MLNLTPTITATGEEGIARQWRAAADKFEKDQRAIPFLIDTAEAMIRVGNIIGERNWTDSYRESRAFAETAVKMIHGVVETFKLDLTSRDTEYQLENLLLGGVKENHSVSDLGRFGYELMNATGPLPEMVEKLSANSEFDAEDYDDAIRQTIQRRRLLHTPAIAA